MHTGVNETMKQGHFLYNLMLSESLPPLTHKKAADVCQTASSSCWSFDILLARLEQFLSNSCSEFLWSCIFHVSHKDWWGIPLTFQWPGWRINSLHCSHYKSNNRNIKHVKWWAFQATKSDHCGHADPLKAFKQNMMVWKCIYDAWVYLTRKTARFTAPWIGTFTSLMWCISC